MLILKTKQKKVHTHIYLNNNLMEINTLYCTHFIASSRSRTSLSEATRATKLRTRRTAKNFIMRLVYNGRLLLRHVDFQRIIYAANTPLTCYSIQSEQIGQVLEVNIENIFRWFDDVRICRVGRRVDIDDPNRMFSRCIYINLQVQICCIEHSAALNVFST